MGADGLARHDDGQLEQFTKLRVIGCAAIGCEGLGEFTNGDGKILYRADEWMAHLETNLPMEANARTIVQSIEKIHPFIELVRNIDNVRGFNKFQNDSGKTYLADFLITSVSMNEMLVLRLRVRMEIVSGLDTPHPYRIVFDKTTHLDGVSPKDSFVHCGAGKISEIDDAFSKDGGSRNYMLVGTHGSFKKLIEGEEIDLDKLADIARCGIALEAEAHPKQVGPPYCCCNLATRQACLDNKLW